MTEPVPLKFSNELSRRMALPQRHRLLQGYPMLPLHRAAVPGGGWTRRLDGELRSWMPKPSERVEPEAPWIRFDPSRPLIVGVLPHTQCNPKLAGCGFCTFPHDAYHKATLVRTVGHVEEEIARVTKKAGLRGVLGETIISFPSPDAKTPAEGLARNEAFIKEFAHDELIRPAVAPHSMYTVDLESLQTSRRLADRYEAPLLIHVAETEGEVTTSRERHQMPPFAYLDSIGFLGPRVVAAHAVWVGDDEVPLLVRTGVGISHNPESNMKLASGTAPIPRYLSSGLAVGLGTDGAASNNDLDMFEAMRQAAFLHKLQTVDPTVVGAPAAVEMATIGGARVLGLEKLIGSIEPGKRADLVLVSMRGARQTPMYNPVSHLVYVSKGADVQTTIVNGRVLMRDRRMLTLDEPAVLAEARKMAERVRAAVK